MTLRAGVDVGGTFTDLVVLDDETGELRAAKIATDYDDTIAPIVEALHLLNAQTQVASLNHATTLSTNAIIEGKLPRGALLTTAGFRDVLDIGRIQRPVAGIYDFNVDNVPPLIARRHRLEVTERIDATGNVVTPLDEAALRSILRELKNPDNAATATRDGISAIAVCGLFSFMNPRHEERIGEIIREELPDVYVSLSSRVSPEIREFERCSTVVLDALLKPIIAPYLGRLRQRLGGDGVEHVHVMIASGGVTDCETAAENPVHTVNSGPAAGVLAAANLAKQLSIGELITIDMGGTSLDIGIVEHTKPVQRFETEIAGYPLRASAVDVAAVAAGGGSLASLDEAGFLQLDRESAGSVPGPACYGRGGTRATVTDADVVLGRLGNSLGGIGGLTLDKRRAQSAFAEGICADLGVDVTTAACSALDIIQARMVKAISANTMEKGVDLREIPLLVYGGAGPTHGVELAQALGMRRVMVPYFAGNFSAIGLLLCPPRADASQMIMMPATAVTPDVLNNHIARLDARLRAQMKARGGPVQELTTHWLAHMRYAGQSYDLAIEHDEPWARECDTQTLATLIRSFNEEHEKRYAYRSEHETVEFVQLRVSVVGEGANFPVPARATCNESTTQTSTRKVYFTTDRQWHTCAVHSWRRALPGQSIDGPAVIEGEGSSVLVPPNWYAVVDGFMSLDIAKV